MSVLPIGALPPGLSNAVQPALNALGGGQPPRVGAEGFTEILPRVGMPGTVPGVGTDGISAFGQSLTNAIGRVNDSQRTANAQVEAFVSGEQEDLHEVMIAMNEAQLHFQLMTEVRNKALDTYQELMRMQI